MTVHAYTPRAVRIALAAGADTLFDAKLATRQGAQLAKLTRWFSPAEVLQQVTVRNAELLALSGPRNPYPGRLGVVESGAIADLILVDGDPVADISLIARPQDAFVAIIKGGQLVKEHRVSAVLRKPTNGNCVHFLLKWPPVIPCTPFTGDAAASHCHGHASIQRISEM